MSAVGVDGWRGGWVAAEVRRRGALALTHHTGFADLLDNVPAGSVVAVDMPIGTVDDGTRAADEAARRWLRERGGPWQSIFLTPPTWAVAAFELDHDHGRAMNRRPAGAAGVSIQAWNLIAKMVEVRDALDADRDVSVVEAHPECSFRALDPTIGLASKKTARGVGLRLLALEQVLDVDLSYAPKDVPVDDVLDAAVLVWTAQRVAAGAHRTLPDGASGPPAIHV